MQEGVCRMYVGAGVSMRAEKSDGQHVHARTTSDKADHRFIELAGLINKRLWLIGFIGFRV